MIPFIGDNRVQVKLVPGCGGRGGGEWCRSLNTEMATDNHLTHNSPPRGESCPP